MKKTMMLMLAMLCGACASVAFGAVRGESSRVTIDTVSIKEGILGGTIALPWNATWVGGNSSAIVVIADNGVPVKSATGSGVFNWSSSEVGLHTLTYTTYINGTAQSEVYSATVFSDGTSGGGSGGSDDCMYRVTIRFYGGGGYGSMATMYRDADLCSENTYYTLPSCSFIRPGYAFAGWRVNDYCYGYADDSDMPVFRAGYSYGPLCGYLDLTATWRETGDGAAYSIYSVPTYGGIPSSYKGCTYNGYALDDGGMVAGTFSLVVKKPAKGKTSAAATLTFISLANGKKTKITGNINLSTGAGSGGLAGLYLGARCVGGRVAKVGILDGGADAAKAKDAAALSVLSKFTGKSYVIALAPDLPDGYAQGGYSTLSISMAAKGKAKVSGVLADGTKVTAAGMMTVGDTYCCVPVIYSKKSRFGFVAWFDRNTRGLVDVTALTPWRNTVKPAFTMDWAVSAAGAKGNVAAGKRSAWIDADGIPELAKLRGFVPGAIAQTPYQVPFTVKGTAWTAEKAAKVAYKGGAVTVTGANVSGMKLTYTAKTGLFKGSFTVYAVKGGKLVKNKFSVFGAVTDGAGWGTAVLKGKGSVTVYVE